MTIKCAHWYITQRGYAAGKSLEKRSIRGWSRGGKEAAEGAEFPGKLKRGIPRGLKPRSISTPIMYGLKPVPFTGLVFFRSLRGLVDDPGFYGRLKAVLFKAMNYSVDSRIRGDWRSRLASHRVKALETRIEATASTSPQITSTT